MNLTTNEHVGHLEYVSLMYLTCYVFMRYYDHNTAILVSRFTHAPILFLCS